MGQGEGTACRQEGDRQRLHADSHVTCVCVSLCPCVCPRESWLWMLGVVWEGTWGGPR